MRVNELCKEASLHAGSCRVFVRTTEILTGCVSYIPTKGVERLQNGDIAIELDDQALADMIAAGIMAHHGN
jgi:hypothetical protein